MSIGTDRTVKVRHGTAPRRMLPRDRHGATRRSSPLSLWRIVVARALVASAALVLILGMLGGHDVAAGTSSSAPGVSSTQITTGAIATLTGPLAADFYALVPGVKAYFDMVNAHGGINGRKLVLAHSLDDGGNPSEFATLARTLVNQDRVFAVAGVSTAFFSPNYFVQAGIPTYGYDVTGNWAGPLNLFAAGGSVEYDAPDGVENAWLIKKVHAKSVAIMAYNVSSSSDACSTAGKELKKAGITVSYEDLNAPIDGNMAPDVQRMKAAGSDYIVSCMDVTGNISMARAVKQYGLTATQLWFNGADQDVVSKYANIMRGVYLNIAHVPLTAPTSVYPGLKTYLTAMKQYEPSFVGDEVAVQGWESAALFAAGVKAAGSDLSWQHVIQVTNRFTSFTAGGLTPVTNWSVTHTKSPAPYCSAFIKAQGSKYVPVYTTGHQVFACFANANPRDTNLVKPPTGTPGT
jgi:branched-chain amino acid transport system substrate-binding protein